MRRTIVLGGGISGLAAARAAAEIGAAPVVLEAAPTLGGLTRSITVGDFSFDYTGHLLHLARTELPSGVPYAGLADGDWTRIERQSFCAIDAALVPAPIQYHFGQLPTGHRERAVDSYERRPPLHSQAPGSFRDFVVAGFGQYLSDLFLIPQNEKTLATSLDRLSANAVKRFFPPPDEARVRAGFGTAPVAVEEYNSRFWYPAVGGIGRLVEGLAAGLTGVELLSGVVELDLRARRLRTARGEEFAWDVLFSSIPLKALVGLCRDPALAPLGAELTHSSLVSIALGLKGPVAEALRGVHWVYVPDRSIRFYRLGCYSNISPGLCPADCHSLYVEAAFTPETLATLDVTRDVLPGVLEDLVRLGWIRPDQVECLVTHVVPCGYVHHTPGRDRQVPLILDRLAAAGVHPIGRYGLWDYLSMEDSIHTGIETARRVLA
jgi:protoporphyrinogen oxidase